MRETPLEMHAADSAFARGRRAPPVAWLATATILLLAALVCVSLVRFEFGPARAQPIAVDEWYFMTCAARGLAVDRVPSAGCHDTKSPLIFLAHQWLQAGAWSFDVVRVKWAGFMLSGLLAAAVALLAGRIGGRLAAGCALALMLLVFSSDRHFFSLKTELLGSVFMLAALLPLVVSQRSPTPAAWFASGLLFGLALMSKQSFVFAVVGVGAWCCICALARPRRIVEGARALLLLSAGTVLPILFMAAVFERQGTLTDFLLSTFIYPTVYGSNLPGSALHQLAWKAGALAGFLQRSPLVILLASFAVAWLVLTRLRGEASVFNRATPVVFALVGMLTLLLVAPILFDYHVLPAWSMLAVLAGVALSWLLRREQSEVRNVVAVVVVVAAGLQALNGWRTLGGKGKDAADLSLVPQLQVAAGDFGYVIGNWPGFYVVTGLVPASDVMYPNGLPGAPSTWAYTPPDPSTSKGHRLLELQRRNARVLEKDFAATPPRYVMVVAEFARAPGSPNVTDIAVLDAYLSARCQFDREVDGGYFERGQLYVCQR